MSRQRLEAFTDGVIAILITILVLELRLPDTKHTWAALGGMLPVFAAYVLSFLVIAGLGLNMVIWLVPTSLNMRLVSSTHNEDD